MGTTETLARWMSETTYEQIPTKAIEQAKKSLLDYLGTAVYGSTTQLGRIVLDFTEEQGGNPQARVIATKIKTAATSAAFANGALGHAEDFDDLGGIGGHPATVLSPTVLALGEQLKASGRDVLTAWVVGYELGTRLSVNVHTERDWHPTAIYGTNTTLPQAHLNQTMQLTSDNGEGNAKYPDINEHAARIYLIERCILEK
jgi:2-methylcitrate dehydratase PrpD